MFYILVLSLLIVFGIPIGHIVLVTNALFLWSVSFYLFFKHYFPKKFWQYALILFSLPFILQCLLLQVDFKNELLFYLLLFVLLLVLIAWAKPKEKKRDNNKPVVNERKYINPLHEQKSSTGDLPEHREK